MTNLTLTINRELQQDITMGLSTLQESVTVTGQAPVVEVTKSEVSSVITQQQIEMLPVANRAAVTLALLLPGTSQDGTRPRRSNAQVGAGTLQFTSNSLADGTMNMSTKAGEPRQDFPQAAIQEFKVFTSQPPAEYGGRAGGVDQRRDQERHELVQRRRLRVLPQQGDEQGRQVHAGGGRSAGQGTDRYNRNQFGGALGGPIVMNRVHFFVADRSTRRKTRSYLVNTGHAAVLRQVRRRVRRRPPEQAVLRPDRRAVDAEAERIRPLGVAEGRSSSARGAAAESANAGQHADSARCAGRGTHVGARASVS